jgi:hypothetical protein
MPNASEFSFGFPKTFQDSQDQTRGWGLGGSAAPGRQIQGTAKRIFGEKKFYSQQILNH